MPRQNAASGLVNVLPASKSFTDTKRAALGTAWIVLAVFFSSLDRLKILKASAAVVFVVLVDLRSIKKYSVKQRGHPSEDFAPLQSGNWGFVTREKHTGRFEWKKGAIFRSWGAMERFRLQYFFCGGILRDENDTAKRRFLLPGRARNASGRGGGNNHIPRPPPEKYILEVTKDTQSHNDTMRRQNRTHTYMRPLGGQILKSISKEKNNTHAKTA